MDEKYDLEVMNIANKLRKNLSVQTDISSRSFNAQMKYANKLKVPYIIVIGEDEIKTKKCKIKDMKTGKEYETKLDAEKIFEAYLDIDEEF